MASVLPRKNKDGVIVAYTIRAVVTNPNGSKTRKAVTFDDFEPQWKDSTKLKKAEAFAATWERDLKEGKISLDDRTFEDYAEYVINLKESGTKCKFTTLDNYKYLLRTVAPHIGKIKIKELKASTLNELYMRFQSGEITGKPMSSKSLKNINGFISTVLQTACREGIVATNAARLIEPIKVTHKDPSTLELDELHKLIDILKDEPIKWQAMLLMLINTGMRRGELCGLKWNKIDLNAGTVEISNNLLRSRETGELREDVPKTRSSIRVLRLPSDMIVYMRQYKAWQNEERLRLGEYFHDQGWVFAQDNGDPIHPESLSQYCGKLSKKSGIHVWAHLLRHTQASILIASGQPVNSVSKRLGHSQVSTTMNIYAHALKNADEGNVKVLENVLYNHS